MAEQTTEAPGGRQAERAPAVEAAANRRNIAWDRGRGELKGASDAEITGAIKDNFMKGDHVYIVFNDKIGDMVQATAFLNGLVEAQDTLGVQKKITVLSANNAISDFMQPYMDRKGIELTRTASSMDGVNEVESRIAQAEEKNSLVIDFNIFEGLPMASQNGENGTVVVRDILSNLHGDTYNNAVFGRDRYARFTEDFLGLEQGALPTERLQPEVQLPPDAEARYQRLITELHIDPQKRQISILLEASTGGRMYDRYDEVVDLLKTKLGDSAQIHMIYDPRRTRGAPEGDEQYQEWKKITDRYGDGSVRLTSLNLNDMPVYLANQDLVLGADSGLGNIAGNVIGGPNVIPLYLPPEVKPHIWETNMQRMNGVSISPDDPMKDPRADGVRCEDPARKRINRIAPEAIANKGLYFLRSRGERPMQTEPAPQAVAFLYQDILGRGPTPSELARGAAQPPQQLAEQLRNSPAKRSQDLTALYQEVLGRTPDQQGMYNFLAELQAGRSLGSVRKIMIDSQEFKNEINALAARSREAAVSRIFQRVLGRQIDPAGRRAYVQNMALSMDTVINALTESDEFRQSYLEAGRDKTGLMVEELYRNVLGREGDRGGLTTYTQRMREGGSRQSVMLAMMQGGEGQASLDRLFAQDKTRAVNMLYQAVLGRPADPGGLRAYTRASSWREVQLALMGSEEYLRTHVN